ncbi:hypothetical protein EDB87DRAFT_1784731 [Lactarius vividus]|nr:hypothetical protein EDB87DRAFT_1784731 [Lactarius vividus]
MVAILDRETVVPWGDLDEDGVIRRTVTKQAACDDLVIIGLAPFNLGYAHGQNWGLLVHVCWLAFLGSLYALLYALPSTLQSCRPSSRSDHADR